MVRAAYGEKQWHCSKNPPVPIIEYRVSKIVPQRYGKGNKIYTALSGSAARRGMSIPMRHQRAASNPHLNVQHRLSPIKRVQLVTPELTR